MNGKSYHGRGEFESCNDPMADGLERYASEEECRAAMHPIHWNMGYFPSKCQVCRGWYIRAGR